MVISCNEATVSTVLTVFQITAPITQYCMAWMLLMISHYQANMLFIRLAYSIPHSNFDKLQTNAPDQQKYKTFIIHERHSRLNNAITESVILENPMMIINI